MNIDFDNIFQHTIPMNEFKLKWRFTEEKYDKLPSQQFAKLKAEINKPNVIVIDSKDAFMAFLRSAPVFKEHNITLIQEARKDINQWGKK